MKDMIKRVREEKGGFTLAELLIVVAIILVLVAIAVPVFTGAQDKANEATRDANIRAAKSAAMVYILEENVQLGDGNNAYIATGTVEKDGSITIKEVKGNTAAGNDVLGTNGETTGDFTVFLNPSDIKAPEEG